MQKIFQAHAYSNQNLSLNQNLDRQNKSNVRVLTNRSALRLTFMQIGMDKKDPEVVVVKLGLKLTKNLSFAAV